jgi:hypothetical protein
MSVYAPQKKVKKIKKQLWQPEANLSQVGLLLSSRRQQLTYKGA